MSSLLFALLRENPVPGLAVASLTVVVAVCFVALSLLLGITVAMIAWVHSLGETDHLTQTDTKSTGVLTCSTSAKSSM